MSYHPYPSKNPISYGSRNHLMQAYKAPIVRGYGSRSPFQTGSGSVVASIRPAVISVTGTYPVSVLNSVNANNDTVSVVSLTKNYAFISCSWSSNSGTQKVALGMGVSNGSNILVTGNANIKLIGGYKYVLRFSGVCWANTTGLQGVCFCQSSTDATGLGTAVGVFSGTQFTTAVGLANPCPLSIIHVIDSSSDVYISVSGNNLYDKASLGGFGASSGANIEVVQL